MIFKTGVEQTQAIAYQVRLCKSFRKYKEGIKLLKKMLRHIGDSSVSYYVISYLIGRYYILIKNYEEANQWLLKPLECEEFWFPHPKDDVFVYKLEYKLRCLPKLAWIKIKQEEFTAAKMLLSEFIVSVPNYMKWGYFDHKEIFPIEICWELIQDMADELQQAKRLLKIVFQIQMDLQSESETGFGDLDIANKFKAERKFQEYLRNMHSLTAEEREMYLGEFLEALRNTSYKMCKKMKRFQLDRANILTKLERFEEALKEFESLMDDGFILEHPALHPKLLADWGSKQENQELLDDWSNIYHNYQQCLSTLNMYDEGLIVAETIAQEVNAGANEELDKEIHLQILEPLYEINYKTGNFHTCKKYLDLAQKLVTKNRKIFKKSGTGRDPEITLVHITHRRDYLIFREMKYLNPSPERFEKILNILPLKYIRHQRSHYLMDNYMHRAICLFQIGRYREAIRLLEDGRVKVPRNEPDILWFHDYVYPVMRGLLSLKMSDRSPETLVNDLKSPAKFEITLKAFKRFDCPPMYAYEYLNLQTVHSKKSSEIPKETAISWRLFKNSALISCKARYQFEMENIRKCQSYR